MPIEKIITGILKIITITLPNKQFLWFKRFIDADIDPKQDKIREPKTKLNNKLYTLSKEIFSIIQAIGIDTKKGICT